MRYLLRLLHPLLKPETLGGLETPLMSPAIVRAIKAWYAPEKQLGIVAYILKGRDITTKAPNELGCAETVSRMIRVLHPEFGVYVGTPEFRSALDASLFFTRIPSWNAKDGTIHMAETGTGLYKHGHVGVQWGVSVLSNNSFTGKVASHMTVDYFDEYYFQKGGFPRQYYKLIK